MVVTLVINGHEFVESFKISNIHNEARRVIVKNHEEPLAAKLASLYPSKTLETRR
jgi:hypothetical protein